MSLSQYKYKHNRDNTQLPNKTTLHLHALTESIYEPNFSNLNNPNYNNNNNANANTNHQIDKNQSHTAFNDSTFTFHLKPSAEHKPISNPAFLHALHIEYLSRYLTSLGIEPNDQTLNIAAKQWPIQSLKIQTAYKADTITIQPLDRATLSKQKKLKKKQNHYTIYSAKTAGFENNINQNLNQSANTLIQQQEQLFHALRKADNPTIDNSSGNAAALNFHFTRPKLHRNFTPSNIPAVINVNYNSTIDPTANSNLSVGSDNPVAGSAQPSRPSNHHLHDIEIPFKLLSINNFIECHSFVSLSRREFIHKQVEASIDKQSSLQQRQNASNSTANQSAIDYLKWDLHSLIPDWQSAMGNNKLNQLGREMIKTDELKYSVAISPHSIKQLQHKFIAALHHNNLDPLQQVHKQVNAHKDSPERNHEHAVRLSRHYTQLQYEKQLNQLKSIICGKKCCHLIGLFCHLAYSSLFSEFSANSNNTAAEKTELILLINRILYNLDGELRRFHFYSLFYLPLLFDSIISATINIFYYNYPIWFSSSFNSITIQLIINMANHLLANNLQFNTNNFTTVTHKDAGQTAHSSNLNSHINNSTYFYHKTSDLLKQIFPEPIAREAKLIRDSAELSHYKHSSAGLQHKFAKQFLAEYSPNRSVQYINKSSKEEEKKENKAQKLPIVGIMNDSVNLVDSGRRLAEAERQQLFDLALQKIEQRKGAKNNTNYR
jgi:hypothetical protein